METFLETMGGQLNEKARLLSISLAHQIDREMAPAFKEAKSISGPGTKQAILEVLLARLGDIRNRFLGQFSKKFRKFLLKSVCMRQALLNRSAKRGNVSGR